MRGGPKASVRRLPKLNPKINPKLPLAVRQARCGPVLVYSIDPLERRVLLASITLTTTVDEVNGNTASIAALIGTPGGAGISLREAIIAANNTAGADTITVPAGTYTLTRIGNDATSQNGDLDINDSVTINGATAATTIIQGASAFNAGTGVYTSPIGDKVIGINQDGTHTGLTVSINNLTVRWGDNQIASGDPTFAYTGGGVDVFLTGTTGNNISFTDCVITQNTNENSYGGGVNIDSGASGLAGDTTTNVFRGTVTFTRVTISDNRTTDAVTLSAGGGVNLFADKHNVNFDTCTITNNRTAGATANGGGVNIRHTNGGTITFTNTNITNNTAGGFGGGVLSAFVQNVSMTGGSISGNTSLGVGQSASGGGIVTGSNVGTTTSLTNVTISNNIATAGADGTGGGVAESSNGTTTLTNCTLSGNSADAGAAVYSQATINISGGTISSNTATARGGALLVTAGATTVTNALINGNSAGATGGGAGYVSGGTLTISGSRIISNTATTGPGIARTAGTATVINNWWGTNNPASVMSGTVGFNPWLQLRVVPLPNAILVASGGTSNVTADINTNSNNVGGFGLPNPTSIGITFSGVKGTVNPTSGNLNASSAATTTWTVGAVSGAGTVSATVDGFTQTASIGVIPLTPNPPDLQSASDSGALNNDNLTNVASPTFDSSAVEAGATVALLRGGTSVATRTGPGALSDTSAPAGTFLYTVTQTVEGVSSAASTGLSVTIDRTAPVAPSTPDLQIASDSGSINTDNLTKITSPTFDLAGTIESGASIQLLRAGVVKATRTGAGSAQDTGPVADGTYSYTARQVDLAGNVGLDSGTLSVTIDTVAAAPSVPDLQAASDSGASNSDNLTNLNSLTLDVLTGVEAGATITLRRDGLGVAGRTGAGAINDGGPLPTGTYAYSAFQTDVAGNVSGPSSGLTVNVDHLQPQMTGVLTFQWNVGPQTLVYMFNENVGPSLVSHDFLVTNRNTSTDVLDGNKSPSGTTTVTLSFTAALADGNYRATVAAGDVTDIAGNPLVGGNVFDFYIYAGDTDHNRTVDVIDLGNLASNYGITTGGTWLKGDTNYDAKVDVTDLGNLSGHYGSTLLALGGAVGDDEAPTAGPAATVAPVFASQPIVPSTADSGQPLIARRRWLLED